MFGYLRGVRPCRLLRWDRPRVWNAEFPLAEFGTTDRDCPPIGVGSDGLVEFHVTRKALRMDHLWPNMAGHVYTDADMETLAAQLATTGLSVEVMTRRYSSSVQYIRVHEGDDFTLQSVGPGDYFAEAMSMAIEQMYAAAYRVSTGLTKLNIRHRLEVRDGQSRPEYRFQHFETQVKDRRPWIRPASTNGWAG
jgi:hypothetical protein